MTEQHPETPVAGPPAAGDGPSAEPFAELERRPVADHVAVFETEHARLQQELSSIDQL
jgi:hypothetical protein